MRKVTLPNFDPDVEVQGDMIPGSIRRGRPYNQTTRLGRVMRMRGHANVYELAAIVKISPMQISRYLNRHEVIRPDHLIRLAEALNVQDPQLLLDVHVAEQHDSDNKER